MPILLHSSSFKSAAAAVAAVAIFSFFSVPASFSHVFVSYVPVIYDNTVFFLKPPYLYLLVNCIIVSIVATSKLTRKSSIIADSDFPEVVIPVPVSSDANSDLYINVVHEATYSGFDDNEVRNDATDDRTAEEVTEVISDKLIEIDGGDNQLVEQEKAKAKSDLPEMEKPKPMSDFPEMEKPKSMSDSLEISILKQTRKPQRFNQQKTIKAPPEGGGDKKAASLGVSKPPRRQDTLETTWKKITEGRSTPLVKQLKKSDTWQERSHEKQKTEKMTKSENLDDRKSETPNRLIREPSPGQEELNRRVEAFIKKFNEEMRLQRLQSLAKYQEVVNEVAP